MAQRYELRPTYITKKSVLRGIATLRVLLARERGPVDGGGPFMLFAAHMAPPAEAGGRFSMLLTSLTVSGH